MNEQRFKKACSITEYEGVPKGMNIKGRNETDYFDSFYDEGVDQHHENQELSEEHCLEHGKDSD